MENWLTGSPRLQAVLGQASDGRAAELELQSRCERPKSWHASIFNSSPLVQDPGLRSYAPDTKEDERL
jgi:hypothetical protein